MSEEAIISKVCDELFSYVLSSTGATNVDDKLKQDVQDKILRYVNAMQKVIKASVQLSETKERQKEAIVKLAEVQEKLAKKKEELEEKVKAEKREEHQ